MLGPVQDYVFNALKPNGPTAMAQWNLDETGGSTAHDSMGAHDLAVTSGAGSWSWSTSGHANGALQLDNGAYAAGPKMPPLALSTARRSRCSRTCMMSPCA
jgi:hypothetical protein